MGRLKEELEAFEEKRRLLEIELNKLGQEEFAFLRRSGCPIVSVSSTDHELAPSSGYYFLLTRTSAKGLSFFASKSGFEVSADGGKTRIRLEEWDPSADFLWFGEFPPAEEE